MSKSEIIPRNTANYLDLGTLDFTEQVDSKLSFRLSWAYRGDYPRLVLMATVKDEHGKGSWDFNKSVYCPFTIKGLLTFIGTLSEFIETAKNGDTYETDCLNNKIVDNRRTDEMYVQGTIKIGKDDNGVFYISLYNGIALEAGRLRFDFAPGAYFKYRINNVTLTDAVLSKVAIKEYVNVIRTSFFTVKELKVGKKPGEHTKNVKHNLVAPKVIDVKPIEVDTKIDLDNLF